MPATFKLAYQHRPVYPRVPSTPGPDMLLAGTISVIIDGAACISFADLPVGTLAHRLKEWLVEGMTSNFSFDLPKQNESGVLTFIRNEDGWTTGSSRSSDLPDHFLDDEILADAVADFISELVTIAESCGITLFPDDGSRGMACVPLPPALHQESTGEPFERCLVCDCVLLEEDCTYVIEKGFRRYPGSDVIDVIHDFALCTDCLTTLSRSYSIESRQRVEAYFRRIATARDRFDTGITQFGPDLTAWTSQCFGKGTPREDLEEYQITCLCTGRDLMFWQYWPMMLGSEALDEIMGLLSKKTLDELDDFHGTHLGIPPEFRHLFRPVLV